MDQDLPEETPAEQPAVVPAPETPKPWVSSQMYDRLKWLAQIDLPALAVFYITVAPLWELPKQEAVSGTIMALDLLLGAFLGLSTRQYNNSGAAFDGSVSLEPDYDNDITNVGVSIDPAALESGQKELRLRVRGV